MLNLPTKCYFLNILGRFYPFFFNTTYRMVAFAAVSFAEGITFGGWLRCLAAPVASNGEDTITAAGNSWGAVPRSARLNFTAVAPDGNAGFSSGIKNPADMTLESGDEANLWVKPLDIVKVSYGKYDNNTLRGDLCYGSWNWMRPNNAWYVGDEGLLMSGNGDTGLMAEVTPMDGLYIQALVPITEKNIKAGDTYKKLRAGFAYTVPGLVKVKGQYIGRGKGSVKVGDTIYTEMKDVDVTDPNTFEIKDNGTIKPKNKTATADADGNSNCTLEAEVDVLAVEGLFAGVGFQYNVVKDGNKSANAEDQMKIALGVSYQVMPELKVSASGAFLTYYKKNDVKEDSRFQAGVGVDYDLGDGLAANADFRYKSKAGVDGTKTKYSDNMSFSVGVVKSVSSNGKIGVAFQGTTNSGSLATIAGLPHDGENKNFVWAIPVAIEVSF